MNLVFGCRTGILIAVMEDEESDDSSHEQSPADDQRQRGFLFLEVGIG